jgi:hypothetical protein
MREDLILLYLIDALIHIEQPRAERFTLTAWLLVQILPDVFLRQILGLGATATQPEADPSPILEIRKHVEAILEKVRDCHANAGNAGARAKCIEDASEELLRVFETYALEMILPKDWQVLWMGVEG